MSDNRKEIIEAALRRYGGTHQHVDFLITGIIGMSSSSQPFQKRKAQTTERIDISIPPDYVSVADNDDYGTCISIVYNNKLYSLCGLDSTRFIKWAEEVAKIPIKQKTPLLPPFPNCEFKKSAQDVRERDGVLETVW